VPESSATCNNVHPEVKYKDYEPIIAGVSENWLGNKTQILVISSLSKCKVIHLKGLERHRVMIFE